MDLLLEIGTEEMPASAVYDGISQIERNLPELLENARVAFDEMRVMGTPRRLAVVVEGLPESAGKAVSRKKGPPLSKARNEDGSWSTAAVGFARSKGVEPDDLLVDSTPGGEYLFAVTETPGEPTVDVMPGVLRELVASLRFPRSMRWGEGEERFSRPVRWILAILDGSVIEFGFGGVTSSHRTRGHRYLSRGEIPVPSAGAYERLLESERVLVDHRRRRAVITEAARRVCEAEALSPVPDEDVLSEVVQLVEWPGVVLGRFEERYLELPRQVLVHAMEEHQRYFPVENGNGELQARFIAVHSGDPGSEETIRKGNERVLAARLSDAEFFFREDLKLPLSERLKDLENVIYQSELGSMAEKSTRLSRLVGRMCDELGFDRGVRTRAQRAAELAKCDLVTHMVVEFPALQGTVGSIYARHSGEDERVAAAISEQYLPRRLGDSLPETDEGALLSLAEKADNLAASFGLGHVPSGSEDPYALRRQSLGMLLIIMNRKLPLSAAEIVRFSAAELEAEAHGFSWTDDTERAFTEFFRGRERVFFTERGYRYDLVDAVLNVGWDRPLSALWRLEALTRARESGLLERLYTAFERCHNLSKGWEATVVSEELLSEDAEKEVYRLLVETEGRVAGALERLDLRSAVEELEALCRPVDRLFDDVLIMAEDERVRSNRLSLIAGVDRLFSTVADFKVLAWD